MKQYERKFWGLIKDHLLGDISRIENAADSGTPDVSGAYIEKDYWVELKATESLKEVRPETLLRSAQLVWHKRRVRQGSKIFVIVKYESLHKFIVYQLIKPDIYVTIGHYEKSGNGYPWEQFQEHLEFAIFN